MQHIDADCRNKLSLLRLTPRPPVELWINRRQLGDWPELGREPFQHGLHRGQLHRRPPEARGGPLFFGRRITVGQLQQNAAVAVAAAAAAAAVPLVELSAFVGHIEAGGEKEDDEKEELEPHRPAHQHGGSYLAVA